MGMPKKKGGFNIHAGVFLPSEPVSHYRCMNLPKTDVIIEHIKMMQTRHLDICRCFFLDKCVIGVTLVLES